MARGIKKGKVKLTEEERKQYRKESYQKWEQTHTRDPIKRKEQNKRSHLLNRESRNKKKREDRLLHPEKGKKKDKKYRVKNHEIIDIKNKQYKHQHPEETKAIHKKYEQSPKGKIVKGKASARRRKNLGYIPLNIFSPGYEGHHIDINYVVYIPFSLHRSIPHDVMKGKNMNAINRLALTFFISQCHPI